MVRQSILLGPLDECENGYTSADHQWRLFQPQVCGLPRREAAHRWRICEGLGFLGITLDAARNGANETVISTGGSRATVCVIHTDEETEIADAVCTVLRLGEP
jgi:hypothetical protein